MTLWPTAGLPRSQATQPEAEWGERGVAELANVADDVQRAAALSLQGFTGGSADDMVTADSINPEETRPEAEQGASAGREPSARRSPTGRAAEAGRAWAGRAGILATQCGVGRAKDERVGARPREATRARRPRPTEDQ
ncbi:RNA polymerase sigma factor rpoD [Actinoplanes friuliensis DSM 7358]|uniref:RNA polymerase sigma factor rpoD n=1 Tax=Actinoplanes friuliensis DSM 7358 TaxID=1246995 RepID=U5W5Z8_9ACTN|nr:RNA polymerase sigma factor rpoD [Actinoplanes friuliensis DSM 7358]